MTLSRGRLDVVARSEWGGGAMFYADAGVSISREGENEPQLIAPAWINIQPGRAIELAPSAMTAELQIKGRKLRSVRGEWILTDEVAGPQWWLANHFSGPMLKEKNRAFSQVIGQDGRGRWLYQKI